MPKFVHCKYTKLLDHSLHLFSKQYCNCEVFVRKTYYIFQAPRAVNTDSWYAKCIYKGLLGLVTKKHPLLKKLLALFVQASRKEAIYYRGKENEEARRYLFCRFFFDSIF